MAYQYTNDGMIYEKYRDDEFLFEIKKHKVEDYYAHFHFATEICCVRSGYFDCVVNGKMRRAVAGDIFFINSGEVHQYLENEDCKVTIAIMSEIYSADFTQEFQDDAFDNVLQNHEVNAQIFALFEEYYEKQKNTFFIENKIFANQMYSILRRNYPVYKRDKNDSLLGEILKYIYKNYANPITLTTIAEHFCYSKVTISKLFQQKVNVDFRIFVNNIRADRVRRMIRDSAYKNWDIISIALECGFASSATFYRTYKRCFGCSPEQEKERKLQK